MEELRQRVERAGFPEGRVRLEKAYQQLLRSERDEMLALVRGDSSKTRTLWQRS